MNNNYLKIVVVDKEEEMGFRVKEVFENVANLNCEVKFFNALVIDEIKGASCVIIDSRLVKDVKNLIEVLNALSIGKIVIATNELNHPISTTAIMMGATVFYRHSPMTTLLPKIIENYQPQRLIKPIQPMPSANTGPKAPPSKLGPTPLVLKNQKHFESDRGKFVMFYSPKGGVGKTSLAINCATHFAMKELKVLLLDYSLFGGIRIKLKIDIHKPGLASILPAVRAHHSVGEIESLIKSSIVKYTFGQNYSFDVLPSDSPISMSKVNVETVEFINNLVHSMGYDVILMDTSSDLSQLNMALFEMAGDIIVIGSPDLSSTWALIQHKEIIQSLNLVSKCKLVVNMSSQNMNFNASELEKDLQYPLLTVIPDNPQTKITENTGSFLSLNPADPFNIYYRQLAHNIIPVFGADDIREAKKKFSLNIFKK